MTTQDLSREIIQELKKSYPKDTRVRLMHMEDEQAPPVGTEGSVRWVDDAGNIIVNWDTGSSLNLIAGGLFRVWREVRSETSETFNGRIYSRVLAGWAEALNEYLLMFRLADTLRAKHPSEQVTLLCGLEVLSEEGEWVSLKENCVKNIDLLVENSNHEDYPKDEPGLGGHPRGRYPFGTMLSWQIALLSGEDITEMDSTEEREAFELALELFNKDKAPKDGFYTLKDLTLVDVHPYFSETPSAGPQTV